MTTAQSGLPADDRAAREIILGSVREYPGVFARDVVMSGRSSLSRSQAKRVIKRLLRAHPPLLDSDHPAETNAYGLGLARLYVAQPQLEVEELLLAAPPDPKGSA